ncbi:MAG: type I 3-dehydroquinate dehydratase [Phycisphaerae bacterium]
MTDIVAPVFARTVAAALPRIAIAHQQGADMIELRCDEASGETIMALLAHPQIRIKPVIVTIRSKAEGGLFPGSELQRLALLAQTCRWQPDYIDIEYEAWRAHPEMVRKILPLLADRNDDRRGKPRLILSYHDLAARPADLRERLVAMAKIVPARIIKAAYQAANLPDALEALRLYHDLRETITQPLVLIAMGDAGLITRLLAAKYDAAFTFAVPFGDDTTAPGQPTIRDLMEIYRFKKQQRSWPVFGVAGWPVAHSISPVIHNAGFEAVDFAGLYVPLPIMPPYESFRGTVELLRQTPELNLQGLSVTIPHKANAARYVKDDGGTLDETSTRIGVINTVYFHENNQTRGVNSDWIGAINALRAGTGWNHNALARKHIAVVGAGGAARAIVAGLASLGVTVVIYNRTLQHAEELAAEFNGKTGQVWAAPLAQFFTTDCAVVINCTPAGMAPCTESLPVANPEVLHSGMVVFDTVYNPRRTRFLEIAAARGATIIEGLEMLLYQAVVQFEGFTGKPAPLKIMRAAAETALEFNAKNLRFGSRPALRGPLPKAPDQISL